MDWRNLLEPKGGETLAYPWVGGRALRDGTRSWDIQGGLPAEHGWYAFRVRGRRASLVGPCRPRDLAGQVTGYLVGDRLVPDGARVDPNPARIIEASERVYLIEPGLDLFARVQAARMFENGPLIAVSPALPLGPEDEVVRAYEDRNEGIQAIRGVTPALDAAFRMEYRARAETEARRAEAERIRREEETRAAHDERRLQLVRQLGDAQARRDLAKVDFEQAARAALKVGGAEYLYHMRSPRQHEYVVRYRLNGRRLECTCDDSLRIVDAGICLTAEYDDDEFDEGTRGDTWFTLESLPLVVREAERENRLVVRRRFD